MPLFTIPFNLNKIPLWSCNPSIFFSFTTDLFIMFSVLIKAKYENAKPFQIPSHARWSSILNKIQVSMKCRRSANNTLVLLIFILIQRSSSRIILTNVTPFCTALQCKRKISMWCYFSEGFWFSAMWVFFKTITFFS